MKSAIPIPNKSELFCSDCHRFKPRALIVAVKWIRNGKHALYRCRTCADQKKAGQNRSATIK
jgi:hypothetical protein